MIDLYFIYSILIKLLLELLKLLLLILIYKQLLIINSKKYLTEIKIHKRALELLKQHNEKQLLDNLLLFNKCLKDLRSSELKWMKRKV